MNVTNRVLTNNGDEPTRRFAWYGYIEDITRWREDIYTGYYVTARGYEFYLRVFNSIPKLFRRPEERSRTFSENFRRFPMITFEEDPKMVRWYTNEFTNYHRYLHMWGYRIVFINLLPLGMPLTFREIFATRLFRDFEVRIFRDTLISRFCENFAFWFALISRFWVRQTLFHWQCCLTCPWIWSNLINNVQINRNATGYVNSNVSVKSKVQHPPPGIPRAFDVFSCPGGRGIWLT